MQQKLRGDEGNGNKLEQGGNPHLVEAAKERWMGQESPVPLPTIYTYPSRSKPYSSHFEAAEVHEIENAIQDIPKDKSPGGRRQRDQ